MDRDAPRTPVKYYPRAAPSPGSLRTPEPASCAAFSAAYDYALRTPEPVSHRGAHDHGLVTPRRAVACKPSPVRSPEYSDRLIPSRAATNLDSGLALLEAENEHPRPNGNVASPRRADDENSLAYTRLLRDELLGQSPPSGSSSSSSGFAREGAALQTPERSRGLFRYRASPEPADDDPLALRKLRAQRAEPPEAAPRQARKVEKTPFRVLAAPNLQDDFYLNCLSNSPSDVLAVGLGRTVDLWSARTGKSTRLCDLGARYWCTSVAWSPDGAQLAIGRHNGDVELWDAASRRKVRTFGGHSRRVGALAWNGYTLSTGSRDHDILHRDTRQPEHFNAKLEGHAQEVCGLTWSPDGLQLASGGNEGSVCIWSARGSGAAQHTFTESEAAVKALAWSPHQRNLLATGGGTADQCIRFWNTCAGSLVSCMQTGGQVCNLAWSKNVDELVSTHGYSSNEVTIWRYPTMTRVATLLGHRARTLYLALSADGQVVITGAGDETIRFWKAFPSATRRPESGLRAGPTSLSRTIR